MSFPPLGIGTYQLKGDDCIRAVKHALDNGYQLIDTARCYGNESEIASAIELSGKSRNELFITSKVNNQIPKINVYPHNYLTFIRYLLKKWATIKAIKLFAQLC